MTSTIPREFDDQPQTIACRGCGTTIVNEHAGRDYCADCIATNIGPLDPDNQTDRETIEELNEIRERDAAAVTVLDEVEHRRAELIAGRRRYHLALVAASDAGVDVDVIAERLRTRPLHVSNTIRRHREGTCSCARTV